MAEQNGRPSSLNKPEEGSRSFMVYVLGAIVIFIVAFLVFRGKNSFTKKEAAVGVTPTVEVSVTVEATVERIISNENTFFIKSAAGFTTVTYTPATPFVSQFGVKLYPASIKAGDKIRMEGKPNGRMFEAKRITLISGGTVSNLPTTSFGKPTPTSYPLPNTGITE